MRIPHWRRLVLKIGSNLIAPGGQALSTRHVLDVARFVQHARNQEREVILVSSGAVAAGRASLHGRSDMPPANVAGKQALAAVGQAELMRFWQRFFDFPVAQLLLTRDDFANRRRFLNARNTLRSLRAVGALPIINENDSVAVDELRVGDNDTLAAHAASLTEAELIVLATDIDGVYDADPRHHPQARRLEEIDQVTDELLAMAGDAGSLVGTGGMRSKLLAAKRAVEAGIATLIIDGRNPHTLQALLDNDCQGTWIRPAQQRRAARKDWMLHSLPTAGQIDIDDGAAEALKGRGASLLASGVVGIGGQFEVGDAVEIHHQGKPLAKGIVQYRHAELNRIRGRHSRDIAAVLGDCPSESVIHRDDLVLM